MVGTCGLGGIIMKSLRMDGQTGIDWVDEQHRDLQDVIDRAVIMILERTEKEEVMGKLDEFLSTWERHCQSEEAHINKINSPRITVMQSEHERVKMRFAKLKGYYVENPDIFQDSTALFELRNLLIKHVIDFDVIELRNPHPAK